MPQSANNTQFSFLLTIRSSSTKRYFYTTLLFQLKWIRNAIPNKIMINFSRAAAPPLCVLVSSFIQRQHGPVIRISYIRNPYSEAHVRQTLCAVLCMCRCMNWTKHATTSSAWCALYAAAVVNVLFPDYWHFRTYVGILVIVLICDILIHNATSYRLTHFILIPDCDFFFTFVSSMYVCACVCVFLRSHSVSPSSSFSFSSFRVRIARVSIFTEFSGG